MLNERSGPTARSKLLDILLLSLPPSLSLSLSLVQCLRDSAVVVAGPPGSRLRPTVQQVSSTVPSSLCST